MRNGRQRKHGKFAEMAQNFRLFRPPRCAMVVSTTNSSFCATAQATSLLQRKLMLDQIEKQVKQSSTRLGRADEGYFYG
jgi:hypothetical protein